MDDQNPRGMPTTFCYVDVESIFCVPPVPDTPTVEVSPSEVTQPVANPEVEPRPRLVMDSLTAVEAADCQPSADDYDPAYRRERFGNNRYHEPKAKARAKRKAAKVSQRRNRYSK